MKSITYVEMTDMKKLTALLRAAPPAQLAGPDVTSVVDYLSGSTGLILSDVLEFHLTGGGKVIIRPSGTEPKPKVCLSARGGSEAKAEQQLRRLSTVM